MVTARLVFGGPLMAGETAAVVVVGMSVVHLCSEWVSI
jgi:hypothetical protein